MKRVIILTLVLSLALSGAAVAAEGRRDAFLTFRHGIGARALAMGGAFVAVADDGTAGFWNPAGLATIGDIRLGGMSTNLFGIGATHQFAHGSIPFDGFALGASWQRMTIANFLEIQGPDGGAFRRIDVEEIHWQESVITASVAADLDFGLVGLNLKFYMAPGIGGGGTGFGFDLGLLVPVGEAFTFGFRATDVGGTTVGDFGIVTGVFTIGGALTALEGLLLATVDVDVTAGAGLEFGDLALGDIRVGLEVAVIEELALRAGVTLFGKQSLFTVGAGINIAGLRVDVAYLLHGLGEAAFGGMVGNHTLIISAEFALGELFPNL